MLLRFARPRLVADRPDRPHARPHELVWAFCGGITNGLIGTWGPVVTGALLHRDDIEPRVAVGTVNAAEMVVALTSVTGMLALLGGDGLRVGVLVALDLPAITWIAATGVAALGAVIVARAFVSARAASGLGPSAREPGVGVVDHRLNSAGQVAFSEIGDRHGLHH